LRETSADDLNLSSCFYQIKETRYVFVPHTDTSMTSRLTDQVLFIGAMNINETFPSVSIVRLDAIQPKNARSDEVTFFIPIGRAGDRDTPTKDGVHRLVASYLLINPKAPERRLKAPSSLAQAEAGGGNRELMNHVLTVEKAQSLFFCIDPDLVAAHFLFKVSAR
jgi:hypothetical protein